MSAKFKFNIDTSIGSHQIRKWSVCSVLFFLLVIQLMTSLWACIFSLLERGAGDIHLHVQCCNLFTHRSSSVPRNLLQDDETGLS